MADPEDEEVESRRSASRRARRDAGADSSKLARELMQLPATSLAKLGLDEELRAVVEAARRITAQVARRRAERSLAGALRRVDLDALAAKLTNVRATGVGNPQRFHLAERWRMRLLDETGAPDAFAAAHPAADHPLLLRLLDAAHRERAVGKPPGAGRALFRHIIAVLDGAERDRELAAEAAEAAEDDA